MKNRRASYSFSSNIFLPLAMMMMIMFIILSSLENPFICWLPHQLYRFLVYWVFKRIFSSQFNDLFSLKGFSEKKQERIIFTRLLNIIKFIQDENSSIHTEEASEKRDEDERSLICTSDYFFYPHDHPILLKKVYP